MKRKHTLSQIVIHYQKALLLIILMLVTTRLVYPQGGGASGGQPDRMFHVAETRIVWDSVIPEESLQQVLSPKIIKAANIFPNSTISTFDLDVAQSKILAIPDVARVKIDIEMLSGNQVNIILKIKTGTKPIDYSGKTGVFVSGKRRDFPTLYQDDHSYVKFHLSGNITPTLMNNTWWGNGKTFTEFNPYGKNPPGSGDVLSTDGYLIAGISGITKINKGARPLYVYGSVKALGVGTFGDELYNAGSNTNSFQIEEFFAGVVGAHTTANGDLIRYNVSIGKQPFKIGNGMLICQIAGNGGTWGGINSWPRFAGKLVGIGQLVVNKVKLEGFYIQPNEYSGNTSNTKLAGINAEYNNSYGLSGGFTYLNVFDSKFPYFFSDLTQSSRKGLNAFNLRGQWTPKPNESFLFIKAEGGLQTNANVPMTAYGYAIEGGWSFGALKTRPSISYRHSLLTGDDPNTKRFERWDILYSGDDMTTWVQGPLMKNILFNSNLETSRFQLQLLPSGWRITAQYSFFRANQLNTIPSPPVVMFTEKNIAQELTFIIERFVSKNLYVRMMGTSLWAGKGIANRLPVKVEKPWKEFVIMLKFSI